ncbi:hypothetical protein V8E36_007370 [Tilletia maclaganii]
MKSPPVAPKRRATPGSYPISPSPSKRIRLAKLDPIHRLSLNNTPPSFHVSNPLAGPPLGLPVEIWEMVFKALGCGPERQSNLRVLTTLNRDWHIFATRYLYQDVRLPVPRGVVLFRAALHNHPGWGHYVKKLQFIHPSQSADLHLTSIQLYEIDAYQKECLALCPNISHYQVWKTIACTVQLLLPAGRTFTDLQTLIIKGPTEWDGFTRDSSPEPCHQDDPLMAPRLPLALYPKLEHARISGTKDPRHDPQFGLATINYGAEFD